MENVEPYYKKFQKLDILSEPIRFPFHIIIVF